MRPILEDGRLQITAAAALLENSRLLHWNTHVSEFQALERDDFELAWQSEVDPVFGRLISWILFAAGAEFLAKGMCLIKGVEIRSNIRVPNHPQGSIDAWVSMFRKNWRCNGTIQTTFFGTMGNLTSGKKSEPSDLMRLCQVSGATEPGRERILAAYELLQKTIRNRDAHAYVPNVRDAHFSLVPNLFAGCFNTMLCWLPGGASTLTTWRAEASAFIKALESA
jgi:hypothetical protein